MGRRFPALNKPFWCKKVFFLKWLYRTGTITQLETQKNSLFHVESMQLEKNWDELPSSTPKSCPIFVVSFPTWARLILAKVFW